MRNEKGLTLIEILVAVVILAIVGTIIWSVFLQGINFSNKAITKNQLTQEANIILTQLRNIHQQADDYQIKSRDCSITINLNNIEYTHPDICYEIYEKDDLNEIDKKIKPKSSVYNSFVLKLRVYHKEQPNQAIELYANLYRLEEEDNG